MFYCIYQWQLIPMKCSLFLCCNIDKWKHCSHAIDSFFTKLQDKFPPNTGPESQSISATKSFLTSLVFPTNNNHCNCTQYHQGWQRRVKKSVSNVHFYMIYFSRQVSMFSGDGWSKEKPGRTTNSTSGTDMQRQ